MTHTHLFPFPAIMFYTVVIPYDVFICYLLAYRGNNWNKDSKSFIIACFFVFIIATAIPYGVGLFALIEYFTSSPNPIERLFIFISIMGIFGALAAVLSVFTAGKQRLVASTLIILSFITAASAGLAKFYIIDMHLQFLINKCKKINDLNRDICRYTITSYDSERLYSIYINISVYSAILILYISIFYSIYLLRTLFKRKE